MTCLSSSVESAKQGDREFVCFATSECGGCVLVETWKVLYPIWG